MAVETALLTARQEEPNPGIHAPEILVATDGSAGAEGALEFLKALPLPAGTRLEVLCVTPDLVLPVPPMDPTPFASAAVLQELYRAEREHAEQVLRRARSALEREALEITQVLQRGGPAHRIQVEAEERRVDLVVVGPVGRTGIDAFLVGSVARNVTRYAPCPVLIARPPRYSVHHVILAVDESEHAAHAAGFLAGFPLPEGAEITVAHVIPSDPVHWRLLPDMERIQAGMTEIRRTRWDAAEKRVEQVCRQLQSAGRPASGAVLEGDPAGEILRLAAERRADLIVAGARGVSLIQGLRIGSVAERLVSTTRCSLLIVR